jgi:hypothetical protein
MTAPIGPQGGGMSTSQPTGHWTGYWSWQPTTHQWNWTWTWASGSPGAQVSGYGMVGQPDAAAEATRLRLMLSALAQIGAPGEADEPAPYSAGDLDQLEAGLREALSELAGLRAHSTAG